MPVAGEDIQRRISGGIIFIEVPVISYFRRRDKVFVPGPGDRIKGGNQILVKVKKDTGINLNLSKELLNELSK